MKRISLLCAFIILAVTANANAANFAIITSPPTLLSVVVLLIAVGCLVVSFKVMDLVRGGALFKGWQIFMLGFICLAISQIFVLLRDLEMLVLPAYVVPGVLALSIILFLFGVIETKKSLS